MFRSKPNRRPACSDWRRPTTLFPMSLISLVVVLVVVGVLLWLLNAYLPMDAKIKQIINVVVVICVVIYVLAAFGVFEHAHDVKVPKL